MHIAIPIVSHTCFRLGNLLWIAPETLIAPDADTLLLLAQTHPTVHPSKPQSLQALHIESILYIHDNCLT